LRSLAPALILSVFSGPVAAPLFAENPPVVVVALDTSKSIGKAGLARARDIALGILPQLGPGAEAALFTFDDQSRLVQARTSREEELRTALSGIAMSGRYTALYDALYDASRYLRDTPGTRKAIVLVTDGRDENSALTIEDGLRVAEESHIPVYAVGVGQVDERVMRRIAKLTGGDYFPPSAGSASAVAARIAAGPASPDLALEKPADDKPSARASSAAPRDAAERAAATRTAVSVPAAATGWGRGWWLGVVLALVAVGAWIALGHRSRPRCATCRRPLPDRLSECAFCSREPTTAPPPSRPRASVETKPTDRTIVGDPAPTVLARVGPGTEEYLEKTIVLRERPVLSVTRGPGMGLVYEVKTSAPTSLGRAKVNDIVLNEDVAVSSEHCRIRPEDGKFVLHDLKSTNGTFVNDRKVTRQPLAEGDTIQVGETYLQFRLEHRRS